MKSFRIAFIFMIITIVMAGVIYVLGWSPQAANDDIGHADEVPQTEVVEISFSPAAAKNIGLDDSTITKIKVTDFYKAITFPAEVTDRPGHSVIQVPSPVSGVVTKIHQESGVAVNPGDPLFGIMLNQQEIIRGQTEFLSLLSQKEINDSEIERLSALGENLVPQK
ncbi:MAG: hypothetical protein FWH27_15020, partial [Planctomycetaceae bacterium]|nr:hypothetical protein [Planctomycetaceae bacterium]